MGVTRHMRGDEAREKCPEIQLPSVPCQRGKADISRYRDAGKEVARVLQKFTPLLERASIDEAYLDITAPVRTRLATLDVQTLRGDMMPDTFCVGYGRLEEFVSEVLAGGSDCIDFDPEHAKQLLVGALIVSEIRAAVRAETGYACSAGVAHCRSLAKLACGLRKPARQSVLPRHALAALYRTLPIKKMKHLGGKFGDAVCDVLGIKTMAELEHFTEKELQAKFDEKNGTWLYNIARGVDPEPVRARFNPKSIGCCKQFKGKAALIDLHSLEKWLRDLADEVEGRLEQDALESNRTPRQMVVSFAVQAAGRDASSSRSYNFSPVDDLRGSTFASKALELVLEGAEGSKPKDDENNRRLKSPIKFLGISVGKFEDNNETKKTKRINDFFAAGASKETIRLSNENTIKVRRKNSEDKNYVLEKFLSAAKEVQKINKRLENCVHENIDRTLGIEATLDKQESFFAKFLNGINKTEEIKGDESQAEVNPMNIEVNRSNTPECNVIPCGDDSVDTNYSGSTIDEEINKSIALFEADPDDSTRVSNMRELLNSNEENLRTDDSEPLKAEPEPSPPIVKPKPQHIETIRCSECGKSIPVNKFDEHADYHLALKLREEERKEMRKDRERRTVNGLSDKEKDIKKKKPEETSNKKETRTSITNYLTKIDSGVPTTACAECGKKVAAEKFSEHQDFHQAQRLSRELNPRPRGAKRKASPGGEPKRPCKPIDHFFGSRGAASSTEPRDQINDRPGLHFH
ncbi:DNApol-eta isoform X2 [Pararge aegeria]|nr:DNApol-eta isoform X2 [Pararge aegeria]XP_039756666.1 DNApol-eta isoform X2 [Pararge aegeria]